MSLDGSTTTLNSRFNLNKKKSLAKIAKIRRDSSVTDSSNESLRSTQNGFFSSNESILNGLPQSLNANVDHLEAAGTSINKGKNLSAANVLQQNKANKDINLDLNAPRSHENSNQLNNIKPVESNSGFKNSTCAVENPENGFDVGRNSVNDNDDELKAHSTNSSPSIDLFGRKTGGNFTSGESVPPNNCKCKLDGISRSNYSEQATLALNGSTDDDFSLSNESFISNASVLPAISTHDARKRSYLAGRVSGHHSLLGANELSRYFPERRIRIFIGTWNMNEKPISNLDEFLLPHEISYLPDVYVVCTQESLVDKKEWEIKVQTSIGPSHVLFHSVAVGVLYLLIFMRRDLVWFCSIPEDSHFVTRPVTAIKTKGAIGVGFMFFGTSLLFITSHLSAHDHKLKERNIEYHKIRTNLQLPKLLATKARHSSRDVTERYDCVFWCGDLNYRITTDHSTVMNILSRKKGDQINVLLHGDQLKNEMKVGNIFEGFEEPKINFLPSYKYDVGSDVFDSSEKHRTPSYTDRILFRCWKKNSIDCIIYNSIPSIKSSDHKPVYGLFSVRIRPGTDNIPLSAGLFNRDVYLEAIKNRALHVAAENLSSSDSSAICSTM